MLECNFQAVAKGEPFAFHELFFQQRAFSFQKADRDQKAEFTCDACAVQQGRTAAIFFIWQRFIFLPEIRIRN